MEKKTGKKDRSLPFSSDEGGWADEIKAEPLHWAPGLEGRFPKGVVPLVAAPPRMGKSTLAVWMAGEVAKAGGATWINDLELPLHQVLIPRLQVADVDGSKVIATKVVYDLDVQADMTRFGNDLVAVRRQGVDLVILDSLERHVRSLMRDGLRKVIPQLTLLADQADVSIVFIAHTNVKVTRGGAYQLIAGSSSLANMARPMYLLGPEPGSEDARIRRMLEEPEAEEPDKTLVLACIDGSVMATPSSLSFTLRGRRHEELDTDIAVVEYVGESTVDHNQVAAAIGEQQRAAAEDNTVAGMLTADLIQLLHQLGAVDEAHAVPINDVNDQLRALGYPVEGKDYQKARRQAKIGRKQRQDPGTGKIGWVVWTSFELAAPLPPQATQATPTTGSTPGSPGLSDGATGGA